MSHPERIVPDETEPGIVALHLKRYEFALPYCRGADVLDAGCGVGYGTAFLAREARRIVGVDVSEEAIDYARRRYAAPNVEFVRADVLELDAPDASFDVACSFETIEHVRDQAAFVRRIARALRSDGVFVVSTPRADETTAQPANPFHTRELAADDLARLLGAEFGQVELYGQRRLQTRRHRLMQRLDVFGLRRRLPFLRPAARLLGTAPTADVTSDGIAISPEHLETATELVAVCRGPRR
jgi:SAM-dependent methyltransferase